MTVSPGQKLSHYRLIEEIGKGGMGVVYRAHDEHLDRDVAVKVLPAGRLSDESARRRFRREALALSRLNHPNIATVHDFDTQRGVDFLVMEYVHGTTLRARLGEGPLAESEIVALGRQLARGLAAAHNQGILHRDLKPGNLRITPEGTLKILDFGLAKQLGSTSESAATETQTLGMVGTLAYMAPEQIRGTEVDERTDVHGAGAVLHEMASGMRPFPEKDTAHLVNAILNRDPEPLRKTNATISADLEGIVLKAMAKTPAKRYSSAAELHADLEKLHRGLSPAARSPRRRRVSWLAAAAVIVVAVSAAVLPVLLRSTEIRSLAVLPLANLSGDSGQDYIADGLTEALITDLGKIGNLRVIARPSVSEFKGSSLPLGEIARILEVDGLVVGSATPAGERIRITVQLIHAGSERQLWSERYERLMSDVLVVQGEVATAIARKIEIALTPEEENRLASQRRVDPAAHRAYLKGRFHVAKFTEADFRRAIEEFQDAVRIDSSYADAYASMGFSYFTLGQPFQISDEEMMPRARDAVARALALDNTIVEAHVTLGLIHLLRDYDWDGTRTALTRAIELNPNHAYAHSMFAFFLAIQGQYDEAILEARRAVELDPRSPIIGTYLAEILMMARQWERAETQANDILRLDERFTRAYRVLAWVYSRTGRYEDAIETFEHRQSLLGTSRETYEGLRRAYEAAGPEGYWRWEFEELGNDLDEAAAKAAEAAAYLGDLETAIGLLERAYRNREGSLPLLLRSSPAFDPLRDDSRFLDLVRKLDLD